MRGCRDVRIASLYNLGSLRYYPNPQCDVGVFAAEAEIWDWGRCVLGCLREDLSLIFLTLWFWGFLEAMHVEV